MAFKGITFAGQNVTPKNDGGLYQAHYGDGILWGCSMNISGDDLVIQSGEMIACGRVVQVDGATSVDLSGRTLQTGYIQVNMNCDLSQGEGLQWYTTFFESATTTFPALTQDDINDNGTLYQIAMAVVQISGGNLTNITWTMSQSMVIFNRGAGRLQIAGNASYKSMTALHSDVNYGGIAFDDTGSFPQTELFATDGRIMFRPKGQGEPTNQMYLDANGQIHGGVKYYVGTGSQSSATGNALTTVKTITGAPTEGGIYLIYCYIGTNTANGNANSIYCFVYNGSSSLFTSTYYEAQQTRHHIRFVVPYIGTPSSDTWTLRVQSAVNLSNITADITMLRIA